MNDNYRDARGRTLAEREQDPATPKPRAVEHTKGPWQLYADLPSANPNWHIVTNESRMRILANVHIEPGNETDLANARLIAAAPELLEALLSLTQVGTIDGKVVIGPRGWEMVQAALAKHGR